jgi:hypothetical protein
MALSQSCARREDRLGQEVSDSNSVRLRTSRESAGTMLSERVLKPYARNHNLFSPRVVDISGFYSIANRKHLVSPSPSLLASSDYSLETVVPKLWHFHDESTRVAAFWERNATVVRKRSDHDHFGRVPSSPRTQRALTSAAATAKGELSRVSHRTPTRYLDYTIASQVQITNHSPPTSRLDLHRFTKVLPAQPSQQLLAESYHSEQYGIVNSMSTSTTDTIWTFQPIITQITNTISDSNPGRRRYPVDSGIERAPRARTTESITRTYRDL